MFLYYLYLQDVGSKNGVRSDASEIVGVIKLLMNYKSFISFNHSVYFTNYVNVTV